MTGIGANPTIYTNPTPPLATVQAALDAFTDGVQAWKAAGEGTVLTAKKKNLRAALAALMRDLCSYMQVACKGNMEWLRLSGIPAQKPIRTSVGPVATPVGPMLSLGDHSGKLDASVTPVFGAVLYSWRLTPSTPNATPVVTQTTAANTTFTGLIPGGGNLHGGSQRHRHRRPQRLEPGSDANRGVKHTTEAHAHCAGPKTGALFLEANPCRRRGNQAQIKTSILVAAGVSRL